MLAPTRMSAQQHGGFIVFHAAESAVSQRGAMACSTCHPDNRTDGLSWRIDKHELQTPVIAGRMVGTHPFKWDGGDPTLELSLTGTMKRLGGFGITQEQTTALAAYIEALPTVRTPTREPVAVQFGTPLHEAWELMRTQRIKALPVTDRSPSIVCRAEKNG